MNFYFYKNYRVKKRLGQNFLCNSSDVKRIVSIIHPKLEDIMVEIGSGLGVFTKIIASYVNNMIAIEIDKDLVKQLFMDPVILEKKVVILEEDVRKINFFYLFLKYNKLLRIFGSLPYNIAISIIFHLCKYNDYIFDIYLILQKEIAIRLVAKPNTKFYGKLSVFMQYFYEIVYILDISPTSFKPVPKVFSSLVRLVPIKPFIFVRNVQVLQKIIEHAFNQRRKIIRNSLQYLFDIEDFKKINLDDSLRAENLTLENYCLLANILDKKIFQKK
ncbi:Ribosomal RNA small subunit methyltransferase A [Candidatus Westeberhardia cardiocondylae]|uniref:Ribosomal RNA small subunit methyltransferase A n=1 Tax=Candidatus Westeberhardia cardiocondylae TaxID=1594731 RepID=A0A0H5BXA4_9ENTR|nr:16S rRNA (adenine(1518)-N(6)/adenine(1519)-N(6))-dimethyltransferase RsmA [Candidatus Westeberhardia cardiocondylae]CEN32344.1 Ribosomal RNA small subunit methyltransferase A [Candidatus Westeberhardia cardiocondylae]